MVMGFELLFMFSPFAVVVAGLLGERFNIRYIRESITVLINLLGIYSVYLLYTAVQNSPNNIILVTIGGYPPLGACFEIDMLGIYMAFSATLLGLLINLYSINYMKNDTRLTEYYTLLTALVIGIVGVAFAGDFITLFIFWEVIGLSGYVLVAFRNKEWASIEASFKYMVMGAVGSTMLLLGIALLYGMSGTVNFAQLSDYLKNSSLSSWGILVFSILIIGFGIKSAIFPLHTWLPDAYSEAPDTVSALLSGISTETAIFALARVFYLIFKPDFFLMPIAVLATITMTFGNIMALRQDDLKRMLAYSSIAQIGYMLIGISTGLTYGLMGTFLHIFNHMLMKGTAFLAVGNIIQQTGNRDLNKMQGIGKMMPLTTISITVALLGLGGVPGTNGFISKFVLFGSSLYAGLPLLALIGILNATLSMAYYLRVVITLLTGKAEEGTNVKEVFSFAFFIPLLMTVLIILFGVFPTPITNFATEASRAITENLYKYIGAVM